MGLALTPYGIFWGSVTAGGSGTVNNWNPTGLQGAVVLYVRPDDFLDLTVTGLAGGEAARLLFIVNYGGPTSGDIVLKPGNAGSSPANRFDFNGGGDISLGSKMAIGLMYHGGSSTWQLIMNDFG